jgi:hypothetical protein
MLITHCLCHHHECRCMPSWQQEHPPCGHPALAAHTTCLPAVYKLVAPASSRSAPLGSGGSCWGLMRRAGAGLLLLGQTQEVGAAQVQAHTSRCREYTHYTSMEQRDHLHVALRGTIQAVTHTSRRQMMTPTHTGVPLCHQTQGGVGAT